VEAGGAVGERAVQVTAVCSPERPDWRWRIVDYDGQTIEESEIAFPTISSALEDGSRRLARITRGDRQVYRR